MTRIGILGAGRIAHTMADTINEMIAEGYEGIELSAIASRDAVRAEAFAHDHDIPIAYGAYEAMLEDPDVDLVYIATPHSLHAEQMLACMEHGKAVLCEKAFTLNARQAYQVLSYSESHGILCTEAIWTRYMPMRKVINDMVWSGIVGIPRTIEANLFYVTSQKPRITDPALGGGALLDVGVYVLNFAEMIFGHPDSITASCTYFPSGVDETDAMFLTWKDGRNAILSAGASSRSSRRGTIFCSEGYIVVDNINNPQLLQAYDADDQLLKEVHAGKQINGYEYEVADAVDALNDRDVECVAMPHEETIHIMQEMDAIRTQLGVRYPDED